MTRKICFALLFSLAACGGSLKYTIDDNTVAGTQAADREQINVARSDEARAEDAQREMARAETTSDNEMSVAENEYKSAKLQRDNANTQRKMADQGGDFNAKNKANKDYTVADKGADEAQAKKSWLEKKHKWQKTMREAADLQVKVSKAKIELEKARLCAAKNIRPSEKFNVTDYDQQVTELNQKFDQKRKDGDDLKSQVDQLERKYQSKKQATESARAAAQS